MPNPLQLLALVTITSLAACGSKEPEAAPDVIVLDVAPTPPAPPPHPTTEEGVLTALTQAFEQKDTKAMQRFLAPEFGAELMRLLEQNPDEFWKRVQLWVDSAKGGIKLGARSDDTAKAERWNTLVEFGDGRTERVTFTRADGKLVLADL